MTDISEEQAKAAARLHNATTLFHAFIYFSPEAAAEYEAIGVHGRAGYFGSRTAAMGELATELVVATFYNFSPDLVAKSMDGLWAKASAADLQEARWRAVDKAFSTHVRPVMSAEAVEEAIELSQAAVDGLEWAGRPMAAGNAAQLRALSSGEFAGNDLIRLWQLVTVIREWRGDAHIGLLIAEPLDGAECTVVSEALAPFKPGAVKTSRAWSEADWAAATDRLGARGWVNADGTITDDGRTKRAKIEHRTNELAVPLIDSIGIEGADRLGELLKPGNDALLAGNYFAAIGRPAPKA